MLYEWCSETRDDLACDSRNSSAADVGGKTCGQLCKSPKSEGRARSAVFIFLWCVGNATSERGADICFAFKERMSLGEPTLGVWPRLGGKACGLICESSKNEELRRCAIFFLCV